MKVTQSSRIISVRGAEKNRKSQTNFLNERFQQKVTASVTRALCELFVVISLRVILITVY